MYPSANRTATTSLSLALLLLAALPAGCIADTTRSPESTDTGLHSDIQRDTPDAANDPDQDGIPSSADLCPETYDPRQKDWDKDGAGDACDPTIDLNESNALVMRDLPVYEHAPLSVDSIGDFDGDGSSDFAIGIPNAKNGTGEVRLYSGEDFSDPAGKFTQIDPQATLVGDQSGALVGCEVGGVGDVNGDGYGDFIALQCRHYERQLAHLILGGPKPILSGDIDSLSEMKFDVSRSNGVPGVEILRLNDLNTDGFEDFALGSSAWMRVIRVIPGAGSFPKEVGCGNYHCVDDWVAAASSVEVPEPAANDAPIHFSVLGDIDGDSKLDLGLVDDLQTDGPEIDVSVVSVSKLPTEVGSSIPMNSISESSSLSSASGVPKFTPLGDLNGDGLSDFSFSFPETSATKIFFGASGDQFPYNWHAPDTEILHNSGSHLIGAFDLNSDGFSDLVFVNNGHAFLLSGSRNWSEEVVATQPQHFDATLNTAEIQTISRVQLAELGNFPRSQRRRFGLVIEGAEDESGTIWVFGGDLPY